MSAVLSQCGRYRYQLGRKWSEGPRVAFIGINPSTADADNDDATVRKWRGFAQRWGFGGLLVGNLFAYRSTDVRELARIEDPVGPENNAHLHAVMDAVTLIVPCWGNVEKVPGWKAKQQMQDRIGVVRSMLRAADKPVSVFGFTAKGDPKHPLMLGYSTELQDWTP